jgi:thioesterase domain-containing protein
VTLSTKELERYLRERIPLSAAMGTTVERADAEGVRLCAPLAPNVNHHGTLFGGSISALSLLSAWTMVQLGLREAGIPSQVVIQRNSVEYLRPIEGDLLAHCPRPPAAEWERFLATLRRRGRARIIVPAELLSGGEQVATFHGSFVAMRTDAAHDEAPG